MSGEQERCEECARLDEQERAAHLTGDQSRRSDLVVLRVRHRGDAHPVGPPSSLLAGPFK